MLLGASEGVHIDSVIRRAASSHYNPVLEFYATSTAGNENDNSINIYSD